MSWIWFFLCLWLHLVFSFPCYRNKKTNKNWISLFWWTNRMVSWCLGQKTPNKRGTPPASAWNEIWDRPSGISETVWGHQRTTCTRTRLQCVSPDGGQTCKPGTWAGRWRSGRPVTSLEPVSCHASAYCTSPRAWLRTSGFRTQASPGSKSPPMSAITQHCNEQHWWLTWFSCVQKHRPCSTANHERVWNRH